MPAKDETISLKPIGYIENNITDPSMSREMTGGISKIILNKEYEKGLFGIDYFERLQIIFYFNLSAGYDLIQIRRLDNREAGVFASRSPRRPNGIGVTVVELLKVEGNVLHVRGLDAVNGTPVLDIKPQIEK